MENTLDFIENEASLLSGLDRNKITAGFNDSGGCLIGYDGKIIGHAIFEKDAYQTIMVYVATHKLKRKKIS